VGGECAEVSSDYTDETFVEDCDDLDYYDDWEYYCDGDQVWKHHRFHDFSCVGGECAEVSSDYTDETFVEDCDDRDYYTDWQYYCDDASVWRTRDFHDFYCLDGTCQESVTPESEWFADCPTDYYTDWQYYCDDASVWRTRDFHDFYCSDGTCQEDVIPETEWVEDIVATASSNSPVNQGGTIQLYGGPAGMTYYWTGPGGWTSEEQNPTRTGATTAMAGTYTLTVTNEYGCGDSATTNVAVNPSVTPAGPAAGGGGCPAMKYLTVDWEGCITEKPLYSNNRLIVDLLGPSPDGVHNLFLERGTHAPVVGASTHYLIIIRQLENPPATPENTIAIVAFNVTPAGARFDRDILLTLGLDESQLPENAQNVTMAYYDDVAGAWVSLPYEAGGPNGVAELTLSAPINHFSIFGVLATVAPPPPPPPAHFVLSGLNIVTSVEKNIFVTRVGKTVTITANVANDGGQEGTYAAVLKLNGQTVDTKPLSLAAGQSQQVSFTRSGLDYGKYEVEVAGLTGEFTVSRTITWWLIALIIVAVGLIIWGVIWSRRRRRTQEATE
jgi:hypothetical protein